MGKSSFKQEHDFEKRRLESARIKEKYPDRIPVIVEKAQRSDIPTIDKKKYLVPADLTVGQFVYVIRKRIKLSAEKAIFIFVDDVLPPTGGIMSALYEEKKDEDGFLYVTYSGENTFGNKALEDDCLFFQWVDNESRAVNVNPANVLSPQVYSRTQSNMGSIDEIRDRLIRCILEKNNLEKKIEELEEKGKALESKLLSTEAQLEALRAARNSKFIVRIGNQCILVFIIAVLLLGILTA